MTNTEMAIELEVHRIARATRDDAQGPTITRLPVREHHVANQRPDWAQPERVRRSLAAQFDRGFRRGREHGYWRGFAHGVIYTTAVLTVGIVAVRLLGGWLS